MTNHYEPDYAVIRPGPGLPTGLLGEYDGKWFELTAIGAALRLLAEPAGRYEVSASGLVAEVWEVNMAHPR